MGTLDADQLCAAINERLRSPLPLTYAETEAGPEISLAGGRPIRFPATAGGRVGGGSAAWMAKKHEHGGLHEPGLVAALLVLAEERPALGTILDVGSLYGYVSLVARCLFPQAQVHAFEANPRSYAALRNNVEANRAAFGDSVHPHNFAVSDASEPGALLRIHHMSVDAVGTGGSVAELERGRTCTIDVWSLDDFCRTHELSPDLVKIDVEGYQAKIMPGARQMIARARPLILLEFDGPGAANHFGVTNREVVRPLLEDGYRLLWGRHRDADCTFRRLDLGDLTDEHEENSLGILVP